MQAGIFGTIALAALALFLFGVGRLIVAEWRDHMGDKKKLRKPEPPPLPDPVLTAINELRGAIVAKLGVEADTILERFDQLALHIAERETNTNRAVVELSLQVLDLKLAHDELHRWQAARDETMDLVLAEILDTVRKDRVVNVEVKVRLPDDRLAEGIVQKRISRT